MDDLILQRRKKLQALLECGIDPYAATGFPRTHLAADVVQRFHELNGKSVAVCGRLRARRSHGKAAFWDLHDASGRIQLHLTVDRLGEERFGLLDLIDIGDFIGAHGNVFRSRRGEITVGVERLDILAKSLRPLPEKWHGLKDVETRFRQRYVDLVMNPEVRDLFVRRGEMIAAIRRLLDGLGFIEVETPIMQPLPGGAAARPFITHHNALDIDLYLRIAPELYLKRMIVGGFEKVYELGRNFRNEGISRKHNPEFTMLELYQAYVGYEKMMDLSERIVLTAAESLNTSRVITLGGQTIDLSPPWRRLAFSEALARFAGIVWEDITPETAAQIAQEKGVEPEGPPTVRNVINKIFDDYVEPNLMEPTLIMDYPVILSPLAKRKADDPLLCERFEPFIGGQELGNAFSELNDPVDQRQRFEEQLAARESGEEEAHVLDEDFVRALEYGMPPTGGLGIGIDRLFMLLTGVESIREVILFPQMRPEG